MSTIQLEKPEDIYDKVRNMSANNILNMGRFQIDGGDYAAAGEIIRDERGHAKDGGLGALTGKLPWHTTFSDESPYSNQYQVRHGNPKSYQYPVAGKWADIAKGHHSYTPSQEMIQAGQTKGLGAYMKRVESGEVLLAPPPYNQKVFE